MMKSKIRARPAAQPSVPTSVASSVAFISSLIIAGILGFFVDALRRAYMPVPWPIVLVMSASCLNITALITIVFIRCFFLSSPILQLLIHTPLATCWTVTVALLARELNEHLVRSCPSTDAFGRNLPLVCHLFKSLFAFTVVTTTCLYFLVLLDIFAWRHTRKAGKYTAIAKKMGSTTEQMMHTHRKTKRLGMLTGMLRKRNKSTQEEEKSIMMNNLNLEEKHDNMLRPDASAATPPPQLSAVPSPEWGPNDRFRVEDYRNQFATQDTRYDPGGRY